MVRTTKSLSCLNNFSIGSLRLSGMGSNLGKTVDTSGWLSQQIRPLKANFSIKYWSVWQRCFSSFLRFYLHLATWQFSSGSTTDLSGIDWNSFSPENFSQLGDVRYKSCSVANPIKPTLPSLASEELSIDSKHGIFSIFSPHNGWLHYGWLKWREEFLVDSNLERTLWPFILTANLIVVLSGCLGVSIVSLEVLSLMRV